MWNKQRYCSQLQSHVWITNFRGVNWKNYHIRKIFVFLRGPTIWKAMPKKCLERYCQLANRTTQQLYKVSSPCIDDHHFKEEELKSVGELSKVSSQFVLKCLFLARIKRPDILWSVNKLARSITKWTKACDKRLNRLISNIHLACEYQQYCYVGNTAKQCRLGLFHDSDFAGYLEDSKIYFGWNIVRFWKSYICANKLHVQATNSSCAQLNRIVNHFFGCRIEVRWYSRSWSMDLIVSFLGNTTQNRIEQGYLWKNKREICSPPHDSQT